MTVFTLTEAQQDAYTKDGFLLVPRLFDAEEAGLLLQIGRADVALAKEARSRRDAQGGLTTLSLRNDLGDDIYSAVVRSERVVNTMERLLGGEVYHYHHKMNMKEPFEGGAWEWHQDYGYWYNNGCLKDRLASCFIAVDRATRENGCMQVLRGSHHYGRIDHGKTGDQTGADMERVREIMKREELVYCEMEPGDAMFFHSNLLHRSDQNRSPHPRWALICCYNARDNDPYKEGPHPRYTPLEKWPDRRVLETGRRQLEAMRPEQ